MTDHSQEPSEKLVEIFARINMSELPAMSVHVQELLGLSSGQRSSNYTKLADVILQDFSLTNKIMQFANSAYYSLGNRVTTVSMAVTVLGFDTIRELAIGISLFDDFIQAGIEKEDISKLLTRSFLSALLARDIADSRDLNVKSEEVFICGLLYNLGKIITCIYLPVEYKEIERQCGNGIAEDIATIAELNGLTFAELGQEVARFWNMTESVIAAMGPVPASASNTKDPMFHLCCIVDFSNRFVDCICNTRQIEDLMDRYGYMLAVDEEEAVEMLERGMEISAAIFDSIRSGLADLDFRDKLEKITNLWDSSMEAPGEQAVLSAGAGDSVKSTGEREEAKSLADYVREMREMLTGSLKMDQFFKLLLEALLNGIGFERVVLLMPMGQGAAKAVSGRYARGDIDSSQVKEFNFFLSESSLAVTQCFFECKILAIPANSTGSFPNSMQHLTRDRTIYLFPLTMKNRAIGVVYLDRKFNRPKLNQEQIKMIKLLCDFTGKAVQKMYQQRGKDSNKNNLSF